MKNFLIKLVAYLVMLASKFAAEGLLIWLIWNGMSNIFDFIPQISYFVAVLLRLLVVFLVTGLPNPRDYLAIFEEPEPRFVHFTFDKNCHENDDWEILENDKDDKDE